MVVKEIQRITGMTSKEIERRWKGNSSEMENFLLSLQNPSPYTPVVSEQQSQQVLGCGIDTLKAIPDASIDSIISDIPYGIDHDEWDVLHSNKTKPY